MERFDVWTVMYQKLDGKLAICNFVRLVDALKKVDELSHAVISELKNKRKALHAVVIGNHKHLIIKGFCDDHEETAIIKVVQSILCVPDAE